MAVRDGAWRRRRLAQSSLYVCSPDRPDLGPFLDAILGAGVDLIQLRDEEAGQPQLRAAAAAFRAAALTHGALFVLNDDPQLAAEVDADGVHVGQEDPHPDRARAAVGPDRLVGRSTHSEEQVDRALVEVDDYFSVGPVEPTPTKPGRPGTGLGLVGYAARVAPPPDARPWFVTGGMAAATIPGAHAAGARRFVVVRAITEAADPGVATRALTAAIHALSRP